MSGWHVYGADGIEKKIASNVVAVSPVLTDPTLNGNVNGTVVDTDSTLAANSDTKLASQKATKSYISSQLGAAAGNLFGLYINNDVTGTGNFASGYLGLPIGTGSVPESFITFHPTRKRLYMGDGLRNRGITMGGFCPFALPWGFDESAATSVRQLDPYNSPYMESLILPFFIPAPMQIVSFDFLHCCQSGLSSIGQINLYEQPQHTAAGNSAEKTAKWICNTNAINATGAGSGATAGGWSSGAVAAGETFIPPGMYFLQLQVVTSSNYLSIPLFGATNIISAGRIPMAYSTRNILTSTSQLDQDLWTNGIAQYGLPKVMIRGAVLGQTTKWGG